MRPPVLVLQHAEVEGPGLLAAPMEEAGLSLRSVRTFLGEAVPRAADGIAGIVVMGGPMGVYEAARHPHLDDEVALVREALRRGLPVLGICLGSQILAAAAGARVHPGPVKEIGWYPVHMTAAGRGDPVLRELPDPSVVFHWHGDTFDLPRGAVLLASSEAYPNQAFLIGDAAYGLQFHLEVTPEMVDRFVAAGEEELAAVRGAGGAARLGAEARHHAPALEPVARRVARAFLRAGRLL